MAEPNGVKSGPAFFTLETFTSSSRSGFSPWDRSVLSDCMWTSVPTGGSSDERCERDRMGIAVRGGGGTTGSQVEPEGE